MAMAWDVKRPTRQGDARAAAPKKAATPAPPSPAAGPAYRFEDIAPTAPGRPASGAALPAPLRHGIRHLSGVALDDVGVHYNSAKPRDVGAEATAQGSAIHLAPGRERHLPHEAWHLVQQRQGRVRPTMQMKGVAINDDDGLEREADRMGALAANAAASAPSPAPLRHPAPSAGVAMPIQRSGKGGKMPLLDEMDKEKRLTEQRKEAREKAAKESRDKIQAQKEAAARAKAKKPPIAHKPSAAASAAPPSPSPAVASKSQPPANSAMAAAAAASAAASILATIPSSGGGKTIIAPKEGALIPSKVIPPPRAASSLGQASGAAMPQPHPNAAASYPYGPSPSAAPQSLLGDDDTADDAAAASYESSPPPSAAPAFSASAAPAYGSDIHEQAANPAAARLRAKHQQHGQSQSGAPGTSGAKPAASMAAASAVASGAAAASSTAKPPAFPLYLYHRTAEENFAGICSEGLGTRTKPDQVTNYPSVCMSSTIKGTASKSNGALDYIFRVDTSLLSPDDWEKKGAGANGEEWRGKVPIEASKLEYKRRLDTKGLHPQKWTKAPPPVQKI